MKKLLIALLLCAAPAHAAISIVQHKAGSSSSSATTVSVTVTSTGSAHVLIVGAANFGTRTVSSITAADCTGSWTQATTAHAVNGAAETDVWWCSSSVSGKTSVVVTFSGAAGTFEKDAEVWEVSGMTSPTQETQNTATGTTSNSQNGASVTTSNATDIIVGVMMVNPSTGVDQNPLTGNAFTSGGDLIGSGGAVSLITASANTYQPAWHIISSGVVYATSTVAFESVVASGCSPTMTLLGVGRCG